MVTWELYPETEGGQGWDSLLLQASDYTVFQSFGWGECKRMTGWHPMRYVARSKDDKVVGMVQLLVKLLPLGFGVAWAPGGPVQGFNSDGGALIGRDLSGLLVELQSNYPHVLVRFNSHIPNKTDLAYRFSQACRRPYFKINSGFTIHMDVAASCDGLVSNLTSKHRYYIKRAEGAGLHWTSGVSDHDIAALVRVHKEMVKHKNLSLTAISEKEVVNFRKSLGEQGLTVLTGYAGAEPVTSCLTLNFGQKSIYMVAATNNRGRDLSAAYAMVTQLILLLQQKGIKHFDFGGIAPSSLSAAGVDHFKRGFGGVVVEYLGEWESAKTEWVKLAMNLAIWKRGGRV